MTCQAGNDKGTGCGRRVLDVVVVAIDPRSAQVEDGDGRGRRARRGAVGAGDNHHCQQQHGGDD